MATDSIQHVVSVEDGIPPLDIQSETEVFRERVGQIFSVTRNTAVVRSTGERLQFHVASVRDGKTGAVCIAEQILQMEHPLSFLHATGGCLPANGLGSFHEAWVPMMRILKILLSVSYLRKQESRFHGIRFKILQHIHADTGVLRDDIAVARVLLSEEIRQCCNPTDWELLIHSIFLPAPCVR